MESRKRWLYAGIAVVVGLAGLVVLANTLLGGLVLGLLWDSVMDLQPLFLAVSIFGGVVGCLLAKLSGGSWKRGVRHGCWLFPIILLLLQLINILAYLLSPANFSFMQ